MSRSTPRIYGLGLLEWATESVFATTAGSYNYVKHVGPVDLSGLEYASLEDEHMRVGITKVARIPGIQTGTITTKHYLHGYSSTLPVGAPTATSHPFSTWLAWALGMQQAGGYVSADPTGSTTSTLKHSDLSSFSIGQAIAYLPATLNKYQVAWVTNNDAAPVPDEITMLQTAQEAPTTNPTIYYGSAVAAMTGNTNDYFSAGVRESIRLRFTSHGGEERYTLRGCMPSSVKFGLKEGELPTMEVTWACAYWDYESAVGAPAAGTYSYAEPESLNNAWVAWGASAATASTIRVSDMEIDLGLKLEPIPSPMFDGAIGGWGYTDKAPMAKFKMLYDVTSNAQVDDFVTQASRIFTFSLGTQPGKMVSFAMGAARVLDWSKPEDGAGFRVGTVALQATNYTGDTGSGGADLIDKDFRIAFL